MSHSWTFCNKCGEPTGSETAKYCDKHTHTDMRKVMVIDECGPFPDSGIVYKPRSGSATTAMIGKSVDLMVYMLPAQAKMREREITELSFKEADIYIERDDNNPHHGPRKDRKGTNKKYIKRKKAANGRTKKRRK